LQNSKTINSDEFGIILHIAVKWNYALFFTSWIVQFRMTLKTNALNAKEIVREPDETPWRCFLD